MAAKKPVTPAKTTKPAAVKPAAVATKPAAAVSSPVRNSPVPKVNAPAGQSSVSKSITHDMIARRAYEISQSPECGSEFDNWVRAERELRTL